MGLATQMLAWDEELLRAAGRARLPRRPLRQPRHRPLDHDRRGRDALAARHDARSPRQRRLPAQRHGRRHLRPDGPPGHRVGPRRRRLDGRDDRPDDGDRAARAGALDGLDDVDDRQPLESASRASRPGACCSPSTRATREDFVDARGPDADGDRLARLPDELGAGRRRSPGRCTTAATTRRGSSARCTRSAPPAIAPRPARASASRPPSCTAARDPLVRPAGGRATARAIPGARLRIFEGMGHDLPRDALAGLRRGDRRQRRARRGSDAPPPSAPSEAGPPPVRSRCG